MKKILFLLITFISASVAAQNEDHIGTYEYYSKDVKGDVIKYELKLNTDQTFTFHFYRNIICSVCKEENSYGKGNWKIENKILHFSTNEDDLDTKNTLNFAGTTARLIKKSPRDLTDKIVPTALQFYKSNIFWIENLKISKKE
ncbi:hypothetical protein [Flavobacterium lacus]|uniref:NlpE-like protein n=1 Tax=Flavobacterium lacus TaxID=1353778 RepID=A0A328WQM6_9FLAO|nr:hypothetical protein [Flavobacterium lacus]RAR48640.1 hypothetical protein B0I10_105258 [Flavobacterium lacus]